MQRYMKRVVSCSCSCLFPLLFHVGTDGFLVCFPRKLIACFTDVGSLESQPHRNTGCKPAKMLSADVERKL